MQARSLRVLLNTSASSHDPQMGRYVLYLYSFIHLQNHAILNVVGITRNALLILFRIQLNQQEWSSEMDMQLADFKGGPELQVLHQPAEMQHHQLDRRIGRRHIVNG